MSLSSLAKNFVSQYELYAKPCEQYSINENDDGCILGQGGFGVVTRQKCKFQKIKCKGEYVAKKTLTHYDATEVLAARQEKLIYDKLSKNPSEYVLSMYGSMIDNKNRKITQYFQYIGGKELLDYKDKRFIKDIVIGLIQGLIYIHDQDVIHCDIKPQNILVDTSKEPHCPVYIDFGGSVQVSNKDDEGVLTTEGLSNIEYSCTRYFRIASEYAKGYITARSDVHALIVTFNSTPLKYNRIDRETVYIVELQKLKLLDAFINMMNYDSGIFEYEKIWPNWKLITNMVKNIPSPKRVPVNNKNHNNPSTFYTMSAMARARMLGKVLINNARTKINKIKSMLTSRTRRRERTPIYAYAKKIPPQGRRKKLDINRMGNELRKIEIARQEEKEQRMMEDNLETDMLAERETKMPTERQAEINKQIMVEQNDDKDEDEEVDEVEEQARANSAAVKTIKKTEAPSWKLPPEEASLRARMAKLQQGVETNEGETIEKAIAKRADAKQTSNRNLNTSNMSNTPIQMNTYLGGVSKKKFRRSSKKPGKIRNRRRSTKKRN